MDYIPHYKTLIRKKWSFRDEQGRLYYRERSKLDDTFGGEGDSFLVLLPMSITRKRRQEFPAVYKDKLQLYSNNGRDVYVATIVTRDFRKGRAVGRLELTSIEKIDEVHSESTSTPTQGMFTSLLSRVQAFIGRKRPPERSTNAPPPKRPFLARHRQRPAMGQSQSETKTTTVEESVRSDDAQIHFAGAAAKLPTHQISANNAAIQSASDGALVGQIERVETKQPSLSKQMAHSSLSKQMAHSSLGERTTGLVSIDTTLEKKLATTSTFGVTANQETGLQEDDTQEQDEEVYEGWFSTLSPVALDVSDRKLLKIDKRTWRGRSRIYIGPFDALQDADERERLRMVHDRCVYMYRCVSALDRDDIVAPLPTLAVHSGLYYVALFTLTPNITALNEEHMNNRLAESIGVCLAVRLLCHRSCGSNRLSSFWIHPSGCLVATNWHTVMRDQNEFSRIIQRMPAAYREKVVLSIHATTKLLEFKQLIHNQRMCRFILNNTIKVKSN